MTGAPIGFSSALFRMSPMHEDHQAAVHRPEHDLVGGHPTDDGRAASAQVNPSIRFVIVPMNTSGRSR